LAWALIPRSYDRAAPLRRGPSAFALIAEHQEPLAVYQLAQHHLRCRLSTLRAPFLGLSPAEFFCRPSIPLEIVMFIIRLLVPKSCAEICGFRGICSGTFPPFLSDPPPLYPPSPPSPSNYLSISPPTCCVDIALFGICGVR